MKGEEIWHPYTKDDRPEEYGRYRVCTSDGLIYSAIWNGTGWAYHNDSIILWHYLPGMPLKYEKAIAIKKLEEIKKLAPNYKKKKNEKDTR